MLIVLPGPLSSLDGAPQETYVALAIFSYSWLPAAGFTIAAAYLSLPPKLFSLWRRGL